MKNKKSQTEVESFYAVKWNAGVLTLLDQRKLPEEVIYLDYISALDVADAISKMVVRGAPAIGIAAAYAVVLAAHSAYQSSSDNWRENIEEVLQTLTAARPTAVNLNWAVSKMREKFKTIKGNPVEHLEELAMKIHHDDITANHEMGRLGAELIEPNSNVITHCNAGAWQQEGMARL